MKTKTITITRKEYYLLGLSAAFISATITAIVLSILIYNNIGGYNNYRALRETNVIIQLDESGKTYSIKNIKTNLSYHIGDVTKQDTIGNYILKAQ